VREGVGGRGEKCLSFVRVIDKEEEPASNARL
jgi:hypothetical protein